MLGQTYTETGMLLKNEELQLVHIKLAQCESVPAHDHKGQEVFFTPIKGDIKVTLDGSEVHNLNAGAVLRFAGEHTVSVEALSECEFFVYLVYRR